jgi:hypothetical protein
MESDIMQNDTGSMLRLVKNHLLITFSLEDILALCHNGNIDLTLDFDLKNGGQISIVLPGRIPYHTNTATKYGTSGAYVTIPSKWLNEYKEFVIIPLRETLVDMIKKRILAKLLDLKEKDTENVDKESLKTFINSPDSTAYENALVSLHRESLIHLQKRVFGIVTITLLPKGREEAEKISTHEKNEDRMSNSKSNRMKKRQKES